MYNKGATLKRLKKPYKHTTKIPQSQEMIFLKGTISALNRNTVASGDYIQNKHKFKAKVSKVVKVPKLYYSGADMKTLRSSIMSLDEFCFKPNHLSRGIGVRILKRDGKFLTDRNGDVLTIDDLIDEANALVKIKRYKGQRIVLLEEVITSHPKLGGYLFSDIRMIFYKDIFQFCVPRLATESSVLANTNSGSRYGVVIDGVYQSDKRFKGTIKSGALPFFDKMILSGQRVSKLFGLIFLSVDLTVDLQGNVVCFESERLPQLQYYLTKHGAVWLLDKIGGRRYFQNTTKRRMMKTQKGLNIPAEYFR